MGFAAISPTSNVSGFVTPGFEGIRDALIANLASGEDVGAQLCVMRGDETIASLHGGLDAHGNAYPLHALQLTYSVSKGVLATCVMQLVAEGSLDLDGRIATIWPEFAANGKGSITLRMLLGHRAGLPFFAKPKSLADLSDWHAVCAELAAQEPAWEPNSNFGYHPITFGFLVGEVIRRVTGVTAGQWLRSAIYEPEALDIYLGLPSSLTPRVSPLFDGNVPTDGALAVALGIDAANNAPIATQAYNTEAAWQCEIPAVNVIASAEGLAKLYARCAGQGAHALPQDVIEDFTAPVSVGNDLVLSDQPSRFGAGFMLSSPREPMLSPYSFGHNGRGGALAFADATSGISFAYLPNRMIHEPTPSSRITRLLDALRDALQ